MQENRRKMPKNRRKVRKKSPKLLKVGEYCVNITVEVCPSNILKTKSLDEKDMFNMPIEANEDLKMVDVKTKEQGNNVLTENEKTKSNVEVLTTNNGKVSTNSCGKTDTDIIVEDILSKFNYNVKKDGYVNVVGLINALGFIIGETDKLESDEDGFISVSGNRQKAVIGINTDRTFEEKRFIAAHELGHYFLDFKENTTNTNKIMHRERKRGHSYAENRIDFFAACLLMPYDSFKNHYEFFKAQNLPEYIIERRLQRLYRTPMESIIRRIGEVNREKTAKEVCGEI